MQSQQFIGLVFLGGITALATPALALDASPQGHSGSSQADRTELDRPTVERTDRGGEGIINGEDASRDDYPMTGGILMSARIESSFGGGDFQSFICSSTLIAPDVVLTAAHCVDIELLEYSTTFGFGTLEDVQQVWSRDADLSMYDGMRSGQPWPDDAPVPPAHSPTFCARPAAAPGSPGLASPNSPCAAPSQSCKQCRAPCTAPG